MPKEVKPVYSTVTNMEDIKRAFFNKDYATFRSLAKEHPFAYYKATYKYSSDNSGRPAYVAKNLLRGFVQQLDDYRKYLMVCFRCVVIDVDACTYTYQSYWMVNSRDPISTILGSLYDDYEFVKVEGDDEIAQVMQVMEKREDIKKCYIGCIYGVYHI